MHRKTANLARKLADLAQLDQQHNELTLISVGRQQCTDIPCATSKSFMDSTPNELGVSDSLFSLEFYLRFIVNNTLDRTTQVRFDLLDVLADIIPIHEFSLESNKQAGLLTGNLCVLLVAEILVDHPPFLFGRADDEGDALHAADSIVDLPA